jgi:hypothetical protein
MLSLGTCVVCGQPTSINHQCPKRVLAARQAAQTRANNEELGYNEDHDYPTNVRLFVGLAMVEQEER